MIYYRTIVENVNGVAKWSKKTLDCPQCGRGTMIAQDGTQVCDWCDYTPSMEKKLLDTPCPKCRTSFPHSILQQKLPLAIRVHDHVVTEPRPFARSPWPDIKLTEAQRAERIRRTRERHNGIGVAINQRFPEFEAVLRERAFAYHRMHDDMRYIDGVSVVFEYETTAADAIIPLYEKASKLTGVSVWDLHTFLSGVLNYIDPREVLGVTV